MEGEKMKGEMGAEVVCVTGATGYVASWLIKRLLEHGYSVRATVRFDPSECERDVGYLTTLTGASDRLQLFRADLTEPESFGPAIEGCVGVFHVSHPMNSNPDNLESEESMTKTSLEGAVGILSACRKSGTVKRIVYTATAGSILFNNRRLEVTDESSWSNLDLCRAYGGDNSAYLVSKTVTERKVLEFANTNGIEVVTVVLPLVVGPFICPKVPSSVNLALAPIFGDLDRYKMFGNMYMVHTDDAARAHIYLMECPIAEGRYICSSVQMKTHEMAQLLFEKFPDLCTPALIEDQLIKNSSSHRPATKFSSKRLLDSGFEFMYDASDIVEGATSSCKEKGFL